MSTNNDEPIIYPADDDHDPNLESSSKSDANAPLSDDRLHVWSSNLHTAKPFSTITTYIYDPSSKLIKVMKPS